MLLASHCYAHNQDTDLCPWKSFSDLLIKDKQEIIGESDTLTATELKQDLDCLYRIYKYQYIGSYYPHETNLADKTKEIKKALTEKMSIYDFMGLIIQSHLSVYDNHFSLNAKTKHYSYYQSLPKYKIYQVKTNALHTLKNCPGFHRYPTLTTNKPIFIKLALENDFKNKTTLCHTVDGKQVSVKLNQIPEKMGVSQKFEYKEIDKDTLYIRIPLMRLGQTNTEKTLLSMIAKDNFQKNLIIDLRGNNGGSSLFGKMVLASLLEKKVMIHYPEELSVDSLYNIAASMNMISNIHADKQSKTILENLLKHYSKRLKNKNLSLFSPENKKVHFLHEQPNQQVLPFPKNGTRLHGYQGTIALLVNRECASACEDFVADMKKLNHVFLIGTHTGGFFNYNDVGFLVLPNSKIQVNTTTSTNIGIQEIKDGIGFAPDFYDTTGTNLIEKAVSFLRLYAPESGKEPKL